MSEPDEQTRHDGAELAELAEDLRKQGVDPEALLAGAVRLKASGPMVTLGGFAHLTARDDLPEASTRTLALARRRDYGAIDNVLARLPVTLADGRVASARIQVFTTLLAKRFAQAVLLAQETGYDPDGWVTVTFSEVSKLLYEGERSSRQYERIRDLFRYLMGAGVGAEFLHDKHRAEGRYSIIQAYVVTEDGSKAHLHLAAAFQSSVLRGHFTYQDLETLHRLLLVSGRSSLPVLLAQWLNSETLPWPSGWRIFATPEGKPVDPYDRQCVAALLGLTNERRRNVVAEIRKAAKIVEEFSDLKITIKKATGKGMWNLYAEHRQAIAAPVESGARADDAPVHERVTHKVHERVTHNLEKDLHPFEETAKPPSCSFPSCSTVIEKDQAPTEPALTASLSDKTQNCPSTSCSARTAAVELFLSSDRKAGPGAKTWTEAACLELKGLTHRLGEHNPAAQRDLCARHLRAAAEAIISRQPKILGRYLSKCSVAGIFPPAQEDGIAAEVRSTCESTCVRGGDLEQMVASWIDGGNEPSGQEASP